MGNESACVKKLFRKLAIWQDFFKIHLLVAHDLWWITNIRNSVQVNKAFGGVHHYHHPARSSEIARMHQDIDITIQALQGVNVHKPFVTSTISVLMWDISLPCTPQKPNQTKPMLHELLSMTDVYSEKTSGPVYGSFPKQSQKHAFFAKRLQKIRGFFFGNLIDFAFTYIFLISELLTMVFFALILHQR